MLPIRQVSSYILWASVKKRFEKIEESKCPTQAKKYSLPIYMINVIICRFLVRTEIFVSDIACVF
nr:unnamed protein product [Callosobruchus analis]